MADVNQETVIQSLSIFTQPKDEPGSECSDNEAGEVLAVNIGKPDNEELSNEKTNKIFCKEPGCNASFKIIKVFRDHLEQEHMFEMNSEKLSFVNMSEFVKWRTNYEQVNFCSFVKKTGTRHIKKVPSVYLYCSRSGIYEPKKGPGGKVIKKSTRSGVVCTASIIYKVLPHGEVAVTVHATHYGHDLDVRQLRLSRQDKESIANALTEGRTPTEILDKMRNSIGPGDTVSSPVSRLSLINKKEIRSVEKQLQAANVSGIPGPCMDQDYVSLDVWCADLTAQASSSAPSPVLYYKPLGYRSDVLTAYDLCLVLMTDHMRRMLTYFGDRLVYLTTLNIPKIQYYVTFLFILDEVNTPFPVLIMVSNKMTVSYTRVMFDTLRSDLKLHKTELATKVFMTDRNDSAFNMWKESICAYSKHMVCPRFCDHEWRKYMATITDETLQDQIYDELCDLLEPKEDSVAKASLQRTLAKMESSEMCTRFVAYFKKFYAPCFNQWGGYRLRELLNLHTGLNFEKTVSEIQETLDAKYKKYAKNIVKILQQLMKRLVSYQYSRTTGLAAIRTMTENHHRVALGIDLKKVYPTEREREWQVVLDVKETVRQAEETPRCCQSEDWECSVTCKQCAVCIHAFTCTCSVYTRQSCVCVHVHLVVRMTRHALLSDVLDKNNATYVTEPPMPIEQVTLSDTEPTEVEEDEVSLRKAIIQSLNRTQDKLYLIRDKEKLRSLLCISLELHTLTCEMHTRATAAAKVKAKVGKKVVALPLKGVGQNAAEEMEVESEPKGDEVAKQKDLRKLAYRQVLVAGESDLSEKNRQVLVGPLSDMVEKNRQVLVGPLSDMVEKNRQVLVGPLSDMVEKNRQVLVGPLSDMVEKNRQVLVAPQSDFVEKNRQVLVGPQNDFVEKNRQVLVAGHNERQVLIAPQTDVVEKRVSKLCENEILSHEIDLFLDEENTHPEDTKIKDNMILTNDEHGNEDQSEGKDIRQENKTVVSYGKPAASYGKTVASMKSKLPQSRKESAKVYSNQTSPNDTKLTDGEKAKDLVEIQNLDRDLLKEKSKQESEVQQVANTIVRYSKKLQNQSNKLEPDQGNARPATGENEKKDGVPSVGAQQTTVETIKKIDPKNVELNKKAGECKKSPTNLDQKSCLQENKKSNILALKEAEKNVKTVATTPKVSSSLNVSANPKPSESPKVLESSPKVPASSPKVPASSPKVPPSSPKVPALSPKVHASSPKVPALSPKVHASSPKVPPSSSKVPASSPKVPASSPKVPPSSPKVPASSPKVPASSPKVPASSPKVPAASPKVPSTRVATATSWDIEIAWQNKKILIPLFNDPKTGIEKIIQKLNAGHFVYKNEKDKRGDIISATKPSIIEQLTYILKSQNPDAKLTAPKPGGPVSVKLLEHKEPLTLKRKIEEFSQQMHVKKENEVLVMNEQSKSADTTPTKKLKNEQPILAEAGKPDSTTVEIKRGIKSETNIKQVAKIDTDKKAKAIPDERVKDTGARTPSIPSGSGEKRTRDSLDKTPKQTISSIHRTLETAPKDATTRSHAQESIEADKSDVRNDRIEPPSTCAVDSTSPVTDTSSANTEEDLPPPEKVAKLEPKPTLAPLVKSVTELPKHAQRIKPSSISPKPVVKEAAIAVSKKDSKPAPSKDSSADAEDATAHSEKYSRPITAVEATKAISTLQHTNAESIKAAARRLADDFSSDDSDEEFPPTPSPKPVEVTPVEKTIPRRVVRTLRPEIQNKFNSSANKGCLKVLKPCIR